MTQKEFQKFVNFLIDKHRVYAPQEEGGEFLIKELVDTKKAAFSSKLPFYFGDEASRNKVLAKQGFYSWKKFFVPECENIFEYHGNALSPVWQMPAGKKGAALLGLNILDLKSVLLYDRVYEKDPYYQNRRLSTLVIAHNLLPKEKHNMARIAYNQINLKHYKFDIFFEVPAYCHPERSANEAKDLISKDISGDSSPASWRAQNDKLFRVFTGSEKGQKVLDDFGYKDYEHIEFIGQIDEDKPGSKMNAFRDKLKNHHNQKIWEELGKICIECGKCTIICPTCFCFRIDDQAELGDSRGTRQRCWDSCFYQEFSEVAGEHRFLNNAAQRIHFWYFHKFARIPDEFSMTGCVGCRRCATVCPVEIDINKVLRDIENS